MKKIISLVLALAMVLTLVPAAVWADDAEDEVEIYDAGNSESPILRSEIAFLIEKDENTAITVEDAFKYASKLADSEQYPKNGLIFVQQKKEITDAKLFCNTSKEVNVTYDLNGCSFTLADVYFKVDEFDANHPDFHLIITDSSDEKAGKVTNKLIDDISSSNIISTAVSLTSALTNIFSGKSDCLVSLAIANKDDIDFDGAYELKIDSGTFGFNPKSGVIDTINDLANYLDTMVEYAEKVNIDLDSIVKKIKNSADKFNFVADEALSVTENTDGTFTVGTASIDLATSNLTTDNKTSKTGFYSVSSVTDESLSSTYQKAAVDIIKAAMTDNTAVTEFVNDNIDIAVSSDESQGSIKEGLLAALNDGVGQAEERYVNGVGSITNIKTSVSIEYVSATAGLESDGSTVYVNGIEYRVKPVAKTTVSTSAGERTAQITIDNDWIKSDITFRLPVAENAGEKVEVFHKSEEDGSKYVSLGYETVYEQNGKKFIELDSGEFSYFKYELYESTVNELLSTLKNIGTVVLSAAVLVGGFTLASTALTKLTEAEEAAKAKADEVTQNISEKVDETKSSISEKLKDIFKTKAQKEAEEKEAAEKAAAEKAAAEEEAAKKAAEEAAKAEAEKKAAEEEAAKKAAEEAAKVQHLDTKTGYKTCSGSACPIAKYTDLDVSSSYHDAIHWALENNVMNGVTTTKFGPNQTLTRAQLVTILFRLDGEKVVNYAMTFTDLRANQYYVEAVRWASANKIVNGVTPTSFCPESPVTREQMYTILYNFAQYRGFDVTIKNSDILTHFSDVKTMTSYAQAPIFWAYGNGLISKNASTLRPLANATRAEAAEMLMLFSQL